MSDKKKNTNKSSTSSDTSNDDKDVIEVVGEVQENLPNTLFRVKLDKKYKEQELTCYLSGKMRKNYIKILPGDRVKVEVSKYDLNRGRIVYRL